MSSSDCTIQPSAATIGHLAEPTNVHNLFVRCAKNARLQEHITRFYAFLCYSLNGQCFADFIYGVYLYFLAKT
jgi:hypothetical protein